MTTTKASSRQQRKSVRFSPMINVYADDCDHHVKNDRVFWSQEDLKTIITSTRLQTRDIKSRHQRQIAALDQIVDAALHFALAADSPTSRTEDSWCADDQDLAWFGPGFARGLERHVSSKYRALREMMVRETRRSVLLQQQSRGGARALAAAYGKQCQAAVLLARFMAQADQHVAAEDEALSLTSAKQEATTTTDPPLARTSKKRDVPCYPRVRRCVDSPVDAIASARAALIQGI